MLLLFRKIVERIRITAKPTLIEVARMEKADNGKQKQSLHSVSSLSENKRKSDLQCSEQTTKKSKCWKNTGLSKRERRRKLMAMCHERHTKQKGVPIHMQYGNRGQFDDDGEQLEQVEYYFENGLRKVKPYLFDYNTFCKERWLGKTLREIYSTEFRAVPKEYYDKMMEHDEVLVNLKPVKSFDIKLRGNDMLTSRIHRHEAPVKDSAIEIVVDNAKFLVVNKPSSIPIHACGRFRHNSLIYLLAREHGYRNLFCCHRLDRLTSGIVIMAKTKDVANMVTTQIREREVEKTYFCKVTGEFPTRLDCHQPISKFNAKHGYVVAQEVDGVAAKEAFTEFERVGCDGETSLVLCRPKTGRTHQIRAHLQYLGYPIINDPIYNNPAWGPERFQCGPITKSLDLVVNDIEKRFTQELQAVYSDAPPNGTLQPSRDETLQSMKTASCATSSDRMSLAVGAPSEASCGSDDRGAKSVPGALSPSPPLSAQSPKSHSSSPSSGEIGPSSSVEARVDPGPNGNDLPTLSSSTGGSLPPQSGGNVEQHQDLNTRRSDCSVGAAVPATGGAALLKERGGNATDVAGSRVVDTEQIVTGDSGGEPNKESVTNFVPYCPECRNPLPDPTDEELVLYLHAYSYKGDGWDFRCSPPEWAKEYEKNAATSDLFKEQI